MFLVMLKVETNKLSYQISLLGSAADSESAFALESLHANMITVLHILAQWHLETGAEQEEHHMKVMKAMG